MRIAATDLHVGLIGIETYGAGVTNLRGPADDAVAFATWAIQRIGVPPANVTVLLAEEAPEQNAHTALGDLAIPEANIRDADSRSIRNYLLEDLPRMQLPAMFLAWSGHGALYRKTANRLLYCADTSSDDPLVFSVREMQQYLRSTNVPNLDRQLLLFDVCAEGTNQTHSLLPLRPVERYKRVPPNAGVTQEAISAAREEQTVKAGAFSEVALKRLPESDQLDWPPKGFGFGLRDEGLAGHIVFIGDDSELGDKHEINEVEEDLLRAIRANDVVGIVGGHIRGPTFLDEGDIAEVIADLDDVAYPFHDRRNLLQVLEFIARMGADHDPVRQLAPYVSNDLAAATQQFELATASQRLRKVARLDLEVFITTAFDDLLESALLAEGKTPLSATYMAAERLDTANISTRNPLVFHLYGRVHGGEDERPPDLTELAVAKRNRAIAMDGEMHTFPPIVRRALKKRHLYVGFDLRDRTLRYLLHAMHESELRGGLGFAIEPAFGETYESRSVEHARSFIEGYLTEIGPCKAVRVMWDFPSLNSRQTTSTAAT